MLHFCCSGPVGMIFFSKLDVFFVVRQSVKTTFLESVTALENHWSVDHIHIEKLDILILLLLELGYYIINYTSHCSTPADSDITNCTL